MLTDTTFWVDLLRERQQGPRGAAHAFVAAHRPHELSVSIISWGELAVGVEHSMELENILRRVAVHALSRQVAWEASRIQRQLLASGAQMGENDNWIAATALTLGLRLVTRDEAFVRVPRLRVVRY